MELIILGILGFLVGIFSGLIGIGGGLLIIPSLLFIYPLLVGQPSMGIKLATGISAVQSIAGSLSSALKHRTQGNAHMGLIAFLGGATMIGSFAGGLTTRLYSEFALTWVYVVILSLTLGFSVHQRRHRTAPHADQGEELPGDIRLHELPGRGVAFLLSVGIGYLSGLMGIGGAILLIPLMLHLMRLPIRLAIGSSSGIIFLTSIATVAGKIISHLLPFQESAVVAAGALLGGYVGADLSQRFTERTLFWMLMTVIFLTLIRMIVELGGYYQAAGHPPHCPFPAFIVC